MNPTLKRLLLLLRKKTTLLFLLILFIGTLLRFISLTEVPPSLYIDEVAIGIDSYDVLHTGKDQFGQQLPLFFKSLGDYKLPLYIYLASGSMFLFGKDEFAIRFPSALAGSITLVVVYFLLYEVFPDKRKKEGMLIGLLSMSTLAISPWHLHFSRGGFEVTVAVLLYLVGFLFAFKAIRAKQSVFLVVSIFSFVATMYTYQSYRIIAPLTLLIGSLFLLKQKYNKKYLLIGSLMTLLLCLPLLLFSFSAEGQARFTQTSAFTRLYTSNSFEHMAASITLFVENYISFFSLSFLFRYGDQNNRHQIQGFGLLFLWQLPFIILGIKRLLRLENKLKVLVLIILGLGPLPAALALPSPHTLRFLLGSVGYSILTGIGLYTFLLTKIRYKKYLIFALLICICIEFIYYLHFYYQMYKNTAILDWGGPCKTVAEKIKIEQKRFPLTIIDKNLDCANAFIFYIPDIPLQYVDVTWYKSQNEKQPILYVRPFYGNKNPDNLMYNIYLPNRQRDIFAQFYKL